MEKFLDDPRTKGRRSVQKELRNLVFTKIGSPKEGCRYGGTWLSGGACGWFLALLGVVLFVIQKS